MCKFEHCNKGFITKSKLEDHMNIHLGLKPHVCKYCGTGFADVANKRMHERCAHEGHKRFEKNNKWTIVKKAFEISNHHKWIILIAPLVDIKKPFLIQGYCFSF